MPDKEQQPLPGSLRDRYGERGANSRDTVNRAVRAEVDGGEELLDASALLYRAAQKLTGRAGELAAKALNYAKGARNAAAEQVIDEHAKKE